jgi:tetratricopeptide (TPR) repeat protein
MTIKSDGEYSAILCTSEMYIRTERYIDALNCFEKSLTKANANANRIVFFEGIGYAFELRGDYTKAIRAYQQAIFVFS